MLLSIQAFTLCEQTGGLSKLRSLGFKHTWTYKNINKVQLLTKFSIHILRKFDFSLAVITISKELSREDDAKFYRRFDFDD